MRLRTLIPAIAFCLIASPALWAKPGLSFGSWARFDDRAGLAGVRAIVASDVPGDAALSALSSEDGMLLVTGRLGLEHDSRWATLGAEIGPAAVEAGADLTGASVLRIRLASAVARPLRVRIKGGDSVIGDAGCYPIVVQMVGTVPADYMIPLAAFHSPGWCGARKTPIEQTLRSVQRVEVTANDEPAGSVRFRVGRIDFLADDWLEPERNWHLAWSDDFEGARGLPATRAGWQTDEGPAGGFALDGLGYLRLHQDSSRSAASARIAIRSSPGRAILYGRTEVRLRVPEATDDERPASIRIALQASSADAGAIVLLERNAEADGFVAGLDGPGAHATAFRMRVRVPSPMKGHFVTIACDRERDRIRWLVDGILVQEISRGDVPASAWSALEAAPLALGISIDDGRSAGARDEALLVDSVHSWQREEAPATAVAAAPQSVAPQSAAPRRRVASAGQATTASTAPSSRRVVCEFSARYQLMLCY
jgi:hypothetical protein